MVVAYLSGKFRDPDPKRVVENVKEARIAARVLTETGWFAVICPHLNSPDPMTDDDMTVGVYVPAHISLLERADILIVMLHWEESHGAMAEVKAAMEASMPVWEFLGGNADEPFLRRVTNDRLMEAIHKVCQTAMSDMSDVSDWEREVEELVGQIHLPTVQAPVPPVTVVPAPTDSSSSPSHIYPVGLACQSPDSQTYVAYDSAKYHHCMECVGMGWLTLINPEVCGTGIGACIFRVTDAGRRMWMEK